MPDTDPSTTTELERHLPADEHALALVLEELTNARRHHSDMATPHEGWAVIYEELLELFDAVRSKTTGETRNGQMAEEAVQIAAMAVRFLVDLDLGEEG